MSREALMPPALALIHGCLRIWRCQYRGALGCAGRIENADRNPQKTNLTLQWFGRFPKCGAVWALRIKKDIDRAGAHGDANAETFGLRLYRRDGHGCGAGLSCCWRVGLVFTGAEKERGCESEDR